MLKNIRTFAAGMLVVAGLVFASAEAFSPAVAARQNGVGCCKGVGSCPGGQECDSTLSTAGCGAENPPYTGRCRTPVGTPEVPDVVGAHKSR